MAEPDIENLLGGYATGTLTDEERRRLFEAALHDQALFDALTREEALKEVLDDPTHRRRLLAALGARRRASRRPVGALLEWLRRPANLALAGTLATAVIAAWVFVVLEQERPVRPPAADGPAKVEQFARQRRAEPQMEFSTAKDVQEPPATGRKPEAEVAPARKKPARPAPAVERRQARGPARSAARAGAEPASEPPATSKASQPKGVDKRPTRSASSAAAPPAKVRNGPVWLTSIRRPVERGPARQLYYARRTPVPRFEPRKPIESRAEEVERAPEASQPEAAQERFGFESTAGLEARGSPEPLGLRYSVLKQDENGDFAETNPDGPFKAVDAMRVTVEVNETGYLYVFRLSPRGEWLWVSPSGPLGKEERESGVGVLSGKRYVIPGTGVLPLYAQPSANKMILIYSRQPRQELRVFHPAAVGRREEDDRSSADLETLLSRAGIEASARPLLVEQIRPDQPGGSQERAVYIVSPEAGRDAAIAIELTLPLQ